MKWRKTQPPLETPLLMSQTRDIFNKRFFFVGEFIYIGDSFCFRHRNAIVDYDMKNFEWLDPNEEIIL